MHVPLFGFDYDNGRDDSSKNWIMCWCLIRTNRSKACIIVNKTSREIVMHPSIRPPPPFSLSLSPSPARLFIPRKNGSNQFHCLRYGLSILYTHTHTAKNDKLDLREPKRNQRIHNRLFSAEQNVGQICVWIRKWQSERERETEIDRERLQNHRTQTQYCWRKGKRTCNFMHLFVNKNIEFTNEKS